VLYLATSSNAGIVAPTRHLTNVLGSKSGRNITWHYEAMLQETHQTIYHPAALKAFWLIFKPTAKPARQ